MQMEEQAAQVGLNAQHTVLLARYIDALPISYRGSSMIGSNQSKLL